MPTPVQRSSERLLALLGEERAVWALIGLSLLLGLFTLHVGLVGDDLPQHAFLEAQRSGGATRPWWDMFALVEGPQSRNTGLRTSGRYPWWVDPELRIVFFRPLTVLTHHLDYRLWPRQLWAMHLHSVAWHMLCCALAWLLARRLCSSSVSAGLAALVYTLCFAHTVPVAWLAHRNGLVSAAFALAAVLAHVRWRSEGHKLAAALAPLALLCSLLAAEAGVAALGLLVAYVLVLDDAPWRSRVLSLVPALAIVVAWRIYYSSMGFGALGSGAYCDPLADPAGFLSVFPLRYAWLLSSSVSPPLTEMIPSWLWIGTSALIAALVFAYAWGSRVARFGLLATLLGCIPLASSHPGDRLLVLTCFGMALVFGELLAAWWGSESGDALRRLAALLVVLVHLIVPPIARIGRSLGLDANELDGAAVPLAAELDDEGLERRGLIILHAPSFIAAEQLPAARRSRGLAAPNFVWLLHDGPAPPQITRVDARTLELEAPGGWPSTELSAYWRSTTRTPFEVGDQIRTLDFVASVVEVDEGKATRVRFEFRAALEHESFAWVSWEDEDFKLARPDAL